MVKQRPSIAKCNYSRSLSESLLNLGSVDTCTGLLPEAKPRYVMGVGYPEDLLVSIALGADMFDCVWPTRTAVSGLLFKESSN